VGFLPPPFLWTRSEILLYTGLRVAVVLGIYLACYRLFAPRRATAGRHPRKLVHKRVLAADGWPRCDSLTRSTRSPILEPNRRLRGRHAGTHSVTPS
jgi:hypothetical protein